MALTTDLPEEIVEEIATTIHENVCSAHLEDDYEPEDDECLAADTQTARDILKILEDAGVVYSPMFVPVKRLKQ